MRHTSRPFDLIVLIILVVLHYNQNGPFGNPSGYFFVNNWEALMSMGVKQYVQSTLVLVRLRYS